MSHNGDEVQYSQHHGFSWVRLNLVIRQQYVTKSTDRQIAPDMHMPVRSSCLALLSYNHAEQFYTQSLCRSSARARGSLATRRPSLVTHPPSLVDQGRLLLANPSPTRLSAELVVQRSRPHRIFLLTLSSLASRLLFPHFSLIPWCSCSTLAAFSGTLTTMPTKN